jgi:uncharacterized protein YabN with tetrapyrrole methylase and pyrophosphatase domain
MKGRHPHLYGEGAKEPWERMKSKRRESLADGLPVALPSLHRAQRLQDRAAGVGFDWPDWRGAAEKVSEELEEARELLEEQPARPAGAAPVHDDEHDRITEELGDLLFACVNLCRKAQVHASLALDRANLKFQHRFEQIEKLARERGIVIGQASLAELDALWDEVKRS